MNNSRDRKLVMITVFVLASCVLSSCTRLAVQGVQKKTDFEYVVPTARLRADNPFAGLDKFIAEADGEANIILTHGLTRKSPDHFDFMVQRLAYKLSLKLTAPKAEVFIVQDTTTEARVVKLGACQLFKWEFQTRSIPKKNVKIFFIYWEPVFQPFKEFIIDYDLTEYRTGLSTLAKDGVFINVLSDLALYLNTRCKVQVHNAILQCIENIDRKGEIAVVGGGFGVQMMFDAMQLELEHRSGSEAEAKRRNPTIHMDEYLGYKKTGDNFWKDKTPVPREFHNEYNIRKVFLIGNQLPFTSLLTLQTTDNTSEDDLNANVFNCFKRFVDQRKEYYSNDALDIVSFYDPNDPFGYKLPPSKETLFTVNNVRLNIAEYWQIDPRKTTDFIVPQMNEKGAEAFLNLIDQKYATQDLMVNLLAPANQSRNDYRIIAALAHGSDYGFVCTIPDAADTIPRQLHPRTKELLSRVKDGLGNAIVGNLTKRIDMKHSVLPFSLPSEFRDFYPNQLSSKSFDGMNESVKQNMLTQLITVHGVKTQEPDHFDMMTREIAKSLGFYETPDTFKIVCSGGVPCPNKPEANNWPGTVKVSRFKSVTGKSLMIYNVYWSSITYPPKRWLDTKSVYPETSVIPRLVKNVLVTDGLSDIELSFENFHPPIMELLKATFNAMEDDFQKSDTTIRYPNAYYMTGSLGTRLLMDYLNTNEQGKTEAVLKRTKTWFMLTNQLIITALKDVPLRGGKITYEDYFKRAFGSANAHMQDVLAMKDFQVVAFNDPNDIMSFIVPDDKMSVENGEKVHNNYINIAQGVQVHMNQLIKIAWRADKTLQKYHRRRYKKILEDFRINPPTLCADVLDRDSEEYDDITELMKIAKNRFRHWLFADIHFSEKHKRNINKRIDNELRKDDVNISKLKRNLKREKKWYTTDLYVSSKQLGRWEKDYKKLKMKEGRYLPFCKPFDRNLIGIRSFYKLYRPGLIMPFLRQVSNYRAYQDFVSDFGRAHVGSRTNKKIISMMSLGFNSVTKTDVDQKLYRKIHNPDEND